MLRWLRKCVNWPAVLGRWLLTPWGTSILTLCTVLAGAWGSVYSPEIKAMLPEVLSPAAWLAGVIFLALVASCGWGYAARQRAAAQERAASVKQVETALERIDGLRLSLTARTNQIERLIRTMPPPAFLDVFARAYFAAEGIARAALATKGTPEGLTNLNLAIRHLLLAIARLAHQFDKAESGDRYAANVMLFYPPDLLRQDARLTKTVAPLLRFGEEGASPTTGSGVLVLDPALTAATGDRDYKPIQAGCDPRDTLLTAVALGLPRKMPSDDPVEEKRPFKLLPAAPHAFAWRSTHRLADTRKIRRFLEDRTICDFTNAVIGEVEQYLGEHPHIRSMWAVPLFAVGDYMSNPAGKIPWQVTPVGVLNIHASTPGLLGGNEDEELRGGQDATPGDFTSVIGPLTFKIATLLDARREVLKALKPAGDPVDAPGDGGLSLP